MEKILQYIIMSLIMERIITEDLPRSTDQQLTWINAFTQCGGRFAGPKLFDRCQPNTCNVSSVGTMLQQQTGGVQSYWINGYIQRSPVYSYEGCVSINYTVIDHLHRGSFNLTNNSPFECFRKCPDTKRIFLNIGTCLCVPREKYIKYSQNIHLEPTSNCKRNCLGSNKETCGGDNVVQQYKRVYSVYVKQYSGQILSSQPVSKTCMAINTTSNNVEFRFCGEKLRYICESHVKSVGTGCYNDESTWYEARQTCKRYEQYLWPRSRNSKIGNKDCESDMHWFGQHSQEKIIWGNDSLPSDPLCLTLHIDSGKYYLQPEKCSKTIYALCNNDVSSPESNTGTTETVLENTVISESTETTRSTKSSRNEERDDSFIVPVVIGVTCGILVVVITVLVFLFIKRRKRKDTISTTVPKRTDYYSEPQKFNEEPAAERQKLVNTTEEGVYNHLGDTEVSLTPSGAVYDVMGRQENDYDIGNANNKRIQRQENDLYDESRDIDTGLYHTGNENKDIARPESSMYNVVDVS